MARFFEANQIRSNAKANGMRITFSMRSENSSVNFTQFVKSPTNDFFLPKKMSALMCALCWCGSK